MKHPYEIGGILFTVAILAGMLGGVAVKDFAVQEQTLMTEWLNEHGEASGKPQPQSFTEYYNDIKGNHPSYYDDVYKIQGDCKKQAYDLQDYFDCVNKP